MFKFKHKKNGIVLLGFLEKGLIVDESDKVKLVIPPEIEGKNVIGIAEDAFRFSGIIELELPKGIKIGDYAFQGNEIKSLKLEGGSIGEYAFRDNLITTLSLDSVTIGNCAFYNNPIKKEDAILKNVNLPYINPFMKSVFRK